MTLPAVRERRRRDIRRDAQDRTPEDRGRDDVAGLARRQRHQARLGQEGAGPGGPLGVGLEHRLLGRRVALVVLVEDLDVVGVAGGIPGERRHLGVEPVELRLPAGAQRAGVVAQHLALLEDPRVAVLAQLPAPVGSSEEGLEVRDPAVEMRRGRLRRRAQAFLAARVLDIPPDEVADVARGASRRVGAALDDQRVGEVRVEVRDPGVDGPLDLPQARDRRVDQVGLRAQPMEEQREQAARHGTRVLHRVPLPGLERREDQPPPQDRAREVAVDGVVDRERLPVGGDLADALQPTEVRPGVGLAPPEGVGGQVVEAVVVLGEAVAAGRGRGAGEVRLQEVVERRVEDRVGHWSLPAALRAPCGRRSGTGRGPGTARASGSARDRSRGRGGSAGRAPRTSRRARAGPGTGHGPGRRWPWAG